jgi:Tfp pilus assembly protein PilZ
MADYWITDSEGRVLGPVGLEVLRDLMTAGRLQPISKVSRDGSSWLTVESVPELYDLGERRQVERAREKQEAVKLRALLEGLRSKPAHEIFKVPKDAPIQLYREAFFRLSKKFHPDSLPKDVDLELAAECNRTFRFLSRLMNQVESAMLARPVEPIRMTPPRPKELPRYDPEEFVGITPVGDRLEAHVRVTRENASLLFIDHPTMNVRHGACFLAGERAFPLGTLITVVFDFVEPHHTISARGKVAWEDLGRSNTRHGFGISFLDLRQGDRDYIRTFVERTRSNGVEHR